MSRGATIYSLARAHGRSRFDLHASAARMTRAPSLPTRHNDLDVPDGQQACAAIETPFPHSRAPTLAGTASCRGQLPASSHHVLHENDHGRPQSLRHVHVGNDSQCIWVRMVSDVDSRADVVAAGLPSRHRPRDERPCAPCRPPAARCDCRYVHVVCMPIACAHARVCRPDARIRVSPLQCALPLPPTAGPPSWWPRSWAPAAWRCSRTWPTSRRPSTCPRRSSWTSSARPTRSSSAPPPRQGRC